LERATAALPMLPPPPPRLSTTKGWPSCSDRFLAIGRAAISEGPPAGHGTITVTVESGQDAARAPVEKLSATTAPAKSLLQRELIFMLLDIISF
jgi:hypothetical protein